MDGLYSEFENAGSRPINGIVEISFFDQFRQCRFEQTGVYAVHVPFRVSAISHAKARKSGISWKWARDNMKCWFRKLPKKITRGGQAVRIQKRTTTKSGVEYSYWAIYWREEGKQRSTSRKSEEAAGALADQIAVRLAKGEIKQRILTGLELAAYDQALQICEAADCSLLDAARFYATEWNKRKTLEINVPDLIKEFLAAKEQDGCSDRYLDDSRLRLKKFGKAFAGQITGIGSRNLDDFLRSLNVSIRSRDNVHKILKSLFSYARARGYLPASERTAAEVLPRLKFKPPVIGILKPDEFARTLEAASTKTLPAFVLGGFCGMRQAQS